MKFFVAWIFVGSIAAVTVQESGCVTSYPTSTSSSTGVEVNEETDEVTISGMLANVDIAYDCTTIVYLLEFEDGRIWACRANQNKHYLFWRHRLHTIKVSTITQEIIEVQIARLDETAVVDLGEMTAEKAEPNR